MLLVQGTVQRLVRPGLRTAQPGAELVLLVWGVLRVPGRDGPWFCGSLAGPLSGAGRRVASGAGDLLWVSVCAPRAWSSPPPRSPAARPQTHPDLASPATLGPTALS